MMMGMIKARIIITRNSKIKAKWTRAKWKTSGGRRKPVRRRKSIMARD